MTFSVLRLYTARPDSCWPLRRAIPLQNASSIFQNLVEAVQELHRIGIIHCDLKCGASCAYFPSSSIHLVAAAATNPNTSTSQRTSSLALTTCATLSCLTLASVDALACLANDCLMAMAHLGTLPPTTYNPQQRPHNVKAAACTQLLHRAGTWHQRS